VPTSASGTGVTSRTTAGHPNTGGAGLLAPGSVLLTAGAVGLAFARRPGARRRP
jgi:hypothetical protein